MRASADCLIEVPGGIVLVRRKFPPEGWALPGGFIEADETAEEAAVREAAEETGLAVRLKGLFGVYSGPDRDPRAPTLTVVYLAEADGDPAGGDDASVAAVFDPRALPRPIAFDHAKIIEDYLARRATGRTKRLAATTAAMGVLGTAAAALGYFARRGEGAKSKGWFR